MNFKIEFTKQQINQIADSIHWQEIHIKFKNCYVHRGQSHFPFGACLSFKHLKWNQTISQFSLSHWTMRPNSGPLQTQNVSFTCSFGKSFVAVLDWSGTLERVEFPYKFW